MRALLDPILEIFNRDSSKDERESVHLKRLYHKEDEHLLILYVFLRGSNISQK